jgi:hypothetical protein
VASLFDRLGRTAIEKAISKPQPAELLLDWLIKSWPKNTITAREIYTYGPHFLHNKKRALEAAQKLVEWGELLPVKTHQRNMYEWKITQTPSPAVSGEWFSGRKQQSGTAQP